MADLQSKALEQFDKLVQRGDIIFKDAPPVSIPAHPFNLQFRIAASLTKKPQVPIKDAQQAPNGTKAKPSPFAKDPPEFVLEHVGSEHTLRFNKFCVVRPQFVLHTNEFKPQIEPLCETDLAAAWNVLHRLQSPYIIIYNGGMQGGWSLPHRHMQFLPRPPRESHELFPDKYGIENGKISQVPFQNAAQRLRPSISTNELFATYKELLESAGVTKEDYSHNLVLVKEWMMIIPRSRASQEGVNIVNAAAMVGMIWIPSNEVLESPSFSTRAGVAIVLFLDVRQYSAVDIVMKTYSLCSGASTLILLLVSVTEARHGHGHGHGKVANVPLDGFGLKRHQLYHRAAVEPLRKPNEISGPKLQRRAGQCEFPSDAGLVAVTPGAQNAGWAMSPDQPCMPGNYCPYACPAGMVMAQWDPSATAYKYPMSMNGGLYCDKSGKITKPFPNKPYCVDASGPVVAKNNCGGVVSFCQTVLPGNEAMLIPTSVDSDAKLAVPNPDYWCSTAAHYYINPPGKDASTACVWGKKDNPWGNWAAFVAGANMDANGQTFLKIGWNPIYLEPQTPFRNKSPSYGVKIECDGGGCNGLPCEIDPSKNAVNEVTGRGSGGAGGANFCVVTVPKGSKASVSVFQPGNNNGGGDDEAKARVDTPSSKKEEPKPSSTPSPSPPPSPSPSTSSTPPSSSSAVGTSSSTPQLTSSSSTVSSISSIYSSAIASTTNSSSSSFVTPTPIKASSVSPQVFVENPSSTISRKLNSTNIMTSPTLPRSTALSMPSAQTTKTGAASIASLSVLSLTASFLVVSLFLSF
ncbi:hypothetical protein LOZ58_001119 [Ophidiomyces ophidiicola]|nr:hypothetical protein LOZ58_001119 [Ophidiomyces ophidiicola]